MKHFIYKTTNTITRKYYIGIHSTKNLNDGYLGSGIYLKRSIKKYGIENFEREILCFFDTLKEAANVEKLIVDDNFIKSDLTYNIGLGGRGGDMIKSLSKEKQKEIRRKQVESTSGINHKDYGIKGEDHFNYGRKWTKEQKEKVTGENHHMWGKKHTKESLEKISMCNFKGWYISPEGKKYTTSRKAAVDTGIPYKTIQYRCKYNIKGWSFEESKK